MPAGSASVNKPCHLLHQHELQQVVHTKRQQERGRNQGVSQPHSNVIFAYMWPLLTNLWNCISSPLIMAILRAAEQESAESTLNPNPPTACWLSQRGSSSSDIQPNSLYPKHNYFISPLKCLLNEWGFYFHTLNHTNDIMWNITNTFAYLCWNSLILISHTGLERTLDRTNALLLKS